MNKKSINFLSFSILFFFLFLKEHNKKNNTLSSYSSHPLESRLPSIANLVRTSPRKSKGILAGDPNCWAPKPPALLGFLNFAFVNVIIQTHLCGVWQNLLSSLAISIPLRFLLSRFTEPEHGRIAISLFACPRPASYPRRWFSFMWNYPAERRDVGAKRI